MGRLPGVMWALVAALPLSAGCSPQLARHGDDGFVFFGGTDDGGRHGPDETDPGAEDLGPGSCAEAARTIYAIDKDNLLLSFSPGTLQFAEVGVIACPTSDVLATPYSIAVDRGATAWVLFSSGELFRVSTRNARCSATGFVPRQAGFNRFAMAFAANGAPSADDTLFVASDDARGGFTQSRMGAIDLTSLPAPLLRPLAKIDGAPDLTGTADGRVIGFFPDPRDPRIAIVDPESGRLSEVVLLAQLAGPREASGVAFWGGDTWLFLKRNTDASTEVHQLSRAGQVTTRVARSGRTVISAGVSTCAPLQPVG
jgi:hypothetical protein